jgi:hypothetical protein
LKPKWQIAGVFIAQIATKLIVCNDALTTHTRSVMGLKKRSLSPVGRGKSRNHRHKWWELVACGTERPTKKGLGFFGHVTGQASGSRQTSITPTLNKRP